MAGEQYELYQQGTAASLAQAQLALFSSLNDSVFMSKTNTPESGYYYDNNGVKKTNASWRTLRLRVANVFTTGAVVGTGSLAYYSTTYPSYLFTDAEGTVLSTNFTNIATLSTITDSVIPSGAVWVIFNSPNSFTIDTVGVYPDLLDKIAEANATHVPESNAALAVPVSDYITELAEGLYAYVTPVNLFNGDVVDGYVINASGELVENTSYSVTADYIPVSGGRYVAYTRAATATTRTIDSARKAFYDANKTFITSIAGNVTLIPANAAYMRVNTLDAYRSYSPMIEYTDEQGTIQPYFSNWFEPHYDNKANPCAIYGDKKLCVFGDSLAANGSGGTNTWIQRVGDALGFSAVYNRGVGSSRVTDETTMYAYVDGDGDAYNRLAYTTQQIFEGYTEIDACCSSADRANTIPTDTNVLLILAGANDVGNTSLDNFKTAYQNMLDNIYARIPSAKVMLCTMPFHKAFDTGASAQTYENFREAIREIGQSYGFPVIDFKREMMVNANNYASFMDSDYVHYNNTSGRKRFAETALPHVQNIRYMSA